jgi:hypothetical protein
MRPAALALASTSATVPALPLFRTSRTPQPRSGRLTLRYGPEVALVGMCQHPAHPATINSKYDCEDWTARDQHSAGAGTGTD